MASEKVDVERLMATLDKVMRMEASGRVAFFDDDAAHQTMRQVLVSLPLLLSELERARKVVEAARDLDWCADHGAREPWCEACQRAKASDEALAGALRDYDAGGAQGEER